MIASDTKLKAVIESLRERPKIPCNTYIKKVIELHKRIPEARARGSDIARARLSASTDRTQIVGFKLRCLQELMYLDDIESRMRDYLQARYVNFMQNYRNKAARDSVMADALGPIIRRTKPIRSTLEIIDVALSDYDAKGWAFNGAVEAMKIAEREA